MMFTMVLARVQLYLQHLLMHIQVSGTLDFLTQVPLLLVHRPRLVLDLLRYKLDLKGLMSCQLNRNVLIQDFGIELNLQRVV
jgi:hypothetical protein